MGPGYSKDCILEDTATRQCLIMKGDKPPAWQGPDLQMAQAKFVKAVERLELAEASLSKKRWMNAETYLMDGGLRIAINTIIKGLPEGSEQVGMARSTSVAIFTNLEGAVGAIQRRDGQGATDALLRALGGLKEFSKLVF